MIDIKLLSSLVRVAEIDIAKNIAEENMLKAELTAKRLRLDEATKAVTDLGDGIDVVQKFSEGLKTDVIQRFEDLLTRGMREIFQKNYTISIDFVSKGNGVSADFYVTLPDGKKVNLAKGEGGGLRDLVGVLQRILYLILEPSRPAKILFLDEDLSFLDSGRMPSAFRFLHGLTSELGIQVIWISHAEAVRSMEDSEGISIIRLGDREKDNAEKID